MYIVLQQVVIGITNITRSPKTLQTKGLSSKVAGLFVCPDTQRVRQHNDV